MFCSHLPWDMRGIASLNKMSFLGSPSCFACFERRRGSLRAVEAAGSDARRMQQPPVKGAELGFSWQSVNIKLRLNSHPKCYVNMKLQQKAQSTEQQYEGIRCVTGVL